MQRGQVTKWQLRLGKEVANVSGQGVASLQCEWGDVVFQEAASEGPEDGKPGAGKERSLREQKGWERGQAQTYSQGSAASA